MNKRVTLNLPIGYAGTTARRIYRTDAGGTVLRFVAEVGNNTDLTFIDSVVDSSLGGAIPLINNELPKPYKLEINLEKLIGTVIDSLPTQVHISQTDIELFDSATFSDISNIGNDNTPVVDMAQDYSLILIGSEKNLYTIDVSGSSTIITQTRAYVGILKRNTMFPLPQYESFPGGIMFVSTNNDVRVFNGNFAQPVATSLDNLSTDNYSQVIQNTLEGDIRSASNMFGAFFDNKYHLIVDQKMYVYEIRGGKWTNYEINTESNDPIFNVMGFTNEFLYIGEQENAFIYRMYADTLFEGEDVISSFETPQLLVSEDVKYFTELHLYFGLSQNSDVKVTMIIENDNANKLTQEFTLQGGSFDGEFYSDVFYRTGDQSEDYKAFYINRLGRWMKFKVESSGGPLYFRGYRILYDLISNKE